MLHRSQWKPVFPKSTRGETDWSSPETLVIIILVVLLGLAFIFYVLKLKGRLLP
ncbi:hypothetical protein HYT55_03405 [Candidatus Woesearchaeota archaeon]|nr:hypothetical protein [Candidatus Woesearchaeota archaeon]